MSDLLKLSPPQFSAAGDTYYDPCVIGLHICGIAEPFGDRDKQPYTALNIPAPDHATARAMFEAARAEAECSRDEEDFLCDLNLGSARDGNEHVTDFSTNRQLMSRLIAAALKAREAAHAE